MAIPKKDVDLATYATNWHARIATGYAAFGLTSAQAAAFAAVYAPWNEAWTALVAARNAGIWSQQLTSNKESARSAMLPTFRELYARVQASRTVSDGSKSLLGVQVRSAQRTPRPAPGAVSDFTVSISGDGALTIRWKSHNPPGTSGTMYQVWRRLGGSDAALAYCGWTGSKSFTDTTVPAGTAYITYQVQAVRGTRVGPWSQHNVNFCAGAGDGGGTSVAEEPSPKLAA